MILYSERLTSSYGIEGQIEVTNVNTAKPTVKIDKIYGGLETMQIEVLNGVKHLICTKSDGRIFDYIPVSNEEWKSNFKTDFIIESDFMTDEEGEIRVVNIFKSGLISLTKTNGDVIYAKETNLENVSCASISVKTKKAVIGTNLGKLVYVDIYSAQDNTKPEIKTVETFNEPVTSVAIIINTKNEVAGVIVGFFRESFHLRFKRGRVKEAKGIEWCNGSV